MTACQGVTGFDRRPRVSREGKRPSKRPSTTGIATSGTRVQFPAPPLSICALQVLAQDALGGAVVGSAQGPVGESGVPVTLSR